MTQFLISEGSGRTADPTMTALEGAVDAAVSFVDFATTIESIALEIETRQAAFLEQAAQASHELRQQQLHAVVAVLEAKNQAIAEIQSAQRSAGLYRPAQHNPQVVLPGQMIITED